MTPTPMSNPLLWDYFRCKPTTPDAKCGNCKRWMDHPDQNNGPRTAFMQCERPGSEACSYVPISFLEENQ